MTPEQLKAYEDALKAKWEAERMVEELRKQFLGPPASPPYRSVELPPLLPSDDIDGGSPPRKRVREESRYSKPIRDFFSERPNRTATIEEAVSGIGPAEHADRLKAAIVRAEKSGLLKKVERGVYRLAREDE